MKQVEAQRLFTQSPEHCRTQGLLAASLLACKQTASQLYPLVTLLGRHPSYKPFFASPLLLCRSNEASKGSCCSLSGKTFNLWPWIPVLSIYGKPFGEGVNDLDVCESCGLV